MSKVFNDPLEQLIISFLPKKIPKSSTTLGVRIRLERGYKGFGGGLLSSQHRR